MIKIILEIILIIGSCFVGTTIAYMIFDRRSNVLSKAFMLQMQHERTMRREDFTEILIRLEKLEKDKEK